CQQGNMFPWTF
nr:immunoglobulin light chain junction region [Mus musculus]